MKNTEPEKDPWDEPHSFLYDLVQFILVLIYIALPVALSFVGTYFLIPLRHSEHYLVRIIPSVALIVPLVIAAAFCHKAKQHADWLMTRKKRKHNQRVDLTR